VLAGTRLRRLVDRSTDAREGPPAPLGWAFVLGWAGMRGIVSLAAALSLPESVLAGAPFPARDLILFITFAVILVTLLGQGLTLPWFIRRLHVADADAGDAPHAMARVRVAEAALRSGKSRDGYGPNTRNRSLISRLTSTARSSKATLPSTISNVT
jgi:monovalent cation/hydrogen antiporter